jgi:hypothetical protein
LCAEECACQIHIDNVPPLIDAKIFEKFRRRAGSSIIEQYIQLAERLPGRVEKILYRQRIADVSWNDQGVIGVRGRFVERVAPTASKYNGIALSEKCASGCATDAGACARDHRDFRSRVHRD